MDPEDIDETICVDCGAHVDPTCEPTFSITAEVVLCFSCSTRRGGAWDWSEEKWKVAPRLEDLPLGSLGESASP